MTGVNGASATVAKLFLNEFTFVDQGPRATSRESFMDRVMASGAVFSGDDEAGGELGSTILTSLVTLLVAISATLSRVDHPWLPKDLFGVVVIIQCIIASFVWQQRWYFHLTFRAHQRRIAKKYGL